MLPTMVRWRVRSTESSTIWPSSRTAMRDSCFVALITISRAIRAAIMSSCAAKTVKDLAVPTTIYFSGSITGGRDDVALYRRIVEALENDGHRVLAGAVAAEHVSASGESIGAK